MFFVQSTKKVRDKICFGDCTFTTRNIGEIDDNNVIITGREPEMYSQIAPQKILTNLTNNNY